MQRLSNRGIEILKEFEGFEEEAYLCPGGVWTIGYGHTKGVKPGDKITEEEGVAFLREDVAGFERCISSNVDVPLNQHQFDALVSLSFNIGCSAFRRSTLRRKLNAGDYKGAAGQFPRWKLSRGKVLNGLIRRREAERALFEEPMPEPQETPQGEPNTPATPKGAQARILAIDGGGVLGLVPAMILAELEARAGKPCGQLFDLIAGTSTGGIIACALASGVSASELVTLYRERSGHIFARDWWRRMRHGFALTGPKYDGAGLREELFQVFRESRLGGVQSVDLLVPTYDIVARRPVFFKSWRAQEDKDRNYLLRDVALATSSAPTYFPPATIKDRAGGTHHYIDGGLHANNPALCALAEMLRRGHAPEDVAMLSLSTGETCQPLDPAAAATWGGLGWITHVIENCMDGQSDVVDYQCGATLAPGRYLRPAWTVPEGIQMDSADEDSLRRIYDAGVALTKQLHDAGAFGQVLAW